MSARARRILPAVLVLLVWFLGVGPLGQFTGRLGEVQTNDGTSFLPASAVSTQVEKLRAGFEDRSVVPAILVWEAPGALGPDAEDRAAAALKRLDGVAAGPVTGPVRSQDGRALQAVVPLKAAGLEEGGDPVGEIAERAVIDGATLHVTGPAAFQADLSTAFAGIDGLLLGVALGVVLLILLLVYRSLVLPLVVIFGAVLALALASAVVYLLADQGVLKLDGQTQGIMFILVVGAATDYALLLAVRFREELARLDDTWAALRIAWRRSVAPIAASAGTVIAGLLTLLLSDLNSTRSLGPVTAIGVLCAMISALTFLPAALALLGRRAYWPSRRLDRGRGVWEPIAGLVSRRPRAVWVAVTLVLCGLAGFAPTLKADGIPQSAVFIRDEPSVAGQKVLGEHFPAGAGNPVIVIAPAGAVADVAAKAEKVQGIAAARPVTDGSDAVKVVDGRAEIEATLTDAPDSDAAMKTVQRLRDALPGSLVGGYSATQLDTQHTAERDRTLIIPVALAVILLVLALLLRAIAAPLMLIATVVLSFAATLGVSALAFDHVFGFEGADPSVPLFAFVFLVALGVDYNIFLMTRVREETVRHGTREGVLRGLVSTGGVITSAGVVLAATFGALAVIPLVFLVEIAFLVAFGVLLDALAVRSLLVPALAYDLSDRVWWPSRLSRAPAPADPAAEPVHTDA